MKTIARATFFMCVAAALTPAARAQITITAADVAAQLAIGNLITSNADTLTTSLNIGAPGATSWNFSALATHTASTVTSVSVASTPFAANFPGATHVLQSPAVYLGVPGTGYLYLTLGTNLLNPGLAAFFSLGFLGSASAIGTNAPADITYALPSTLGTTWTSTYTETQNIFVNGGLVSSTVTNHNLSYEVDAYGSLTIPGGTVHDALRIRKVESAGTKTVGYIFLARDGASVQVTASDTLQPTSGVITVQRKSSWTAGNPALPVQLASFAASLDDQGTAVRLRWRTLSEVNNYGFDVQKGRSAAGDFVSVPGGFVPGNGTTDAPHDYGFVDRDFSGGTCYYRLRQIDRDGSSRTTEPLKVESLTAVRESTAPAAYTLEQNYPNPFNPSTDIRFTLADPGHATLRVYDVLGREVMTLVDGEMQAGTHSVRVDASRFSSGVYTYVLRAGSFNAARKFLLCR